MRAIIKAIEYHLPETILDNERLAAEFPEWSVGKIAEKTGIRARCITAEGECSSDLGVAAARKLFASGACAPEEIDYLLFCTQSPDYLLPSTACLMQDRLGIPSAAGALDFNLGCSGFVYGLGMAKGLIETGQARKVLLVTAETYSKFLDRADKSVRTLFGDAAAATLVEAADRAEEAIGPFVYGTDGSGGEKLIVRRGGMRCPGPPAGGLTMNGPDIFNFTLKAVPESVQRLVAASGKSLDEIDLFVFHQANRYMLEYLRKKLRLPEEKFVIWMESCGNTVSSTIPIALKEAARQGTLRPGALTMLVGFGVGLSWGACLARWPESWHNGGDPA